MSKKVLPQICSKIIKKSYSTSALQKTFGIPKPVKKYAKYIKERIANSGLDASKSYFEFIQKDLIKPLHSDSFYDSIHRPERHNWALKTVKQCPIKSLLPKSQQYQNLFYPCRSQFDIEKYQNSFLNSDHIAIRIPQIRKIDEKDSFLLKKEQYGAHTETIMGWKPKPVDKSLSNKSSVGYNILSNESNLNKVKAYLLDNKINFKKKGVGEYADLSKVYSINYNKEYQSKSFSDDHLFHNYKGIFSHVYDVAHRNGNIIVPFKKGGSVNTFNVKINNPDKSKYGKKASL